MCTSKNFAHRGVGGGRVGQHGPVGAGDLAALHRHLPQRTNFVWAPGAGELVDRDAVAAVERLVQQLGALVVLAGEHHAARMQIVLAGGGGFRQTELDDDLPQLGIRQAGADDRAMQVAVEFPDLAPAARLWLQYLLHSQRQLALGQSRQRHPLQRTSASRMCGAKSAKISAASPRRPARSTCRTGWRRRRVRCSGGPYDRVPRA